MASRSATWFIKCVAALCTMFIVESSAAPNADIVFVGQIPNPTDFATANATFGNHLASIESIIRGGDLFIRYRDGKIKNLTRLAGYGNPGFQGAGAIAVRDPAVSWDGTQVIFSMVVGAPTEQYEGSTYFWQLYEVTGLGENDTPVITKVPRQPERYNNISPAYASDDTIFFTSDRPRNGEVHLYPQRDEYESQPTVSGLWNLNPATGALRLLDHAPSGVFEPIVDSFGRVVFTRWDHLQQDQQADDTDEYGAFDYSSEAREASRMNKKPEVFPEPRVRSLMEDSGANPHDFNHFFPWQINQDGTGHETLNHIGRHELHGYFDRSRNDDDNLEEHYAEDPPTIHREIENFFHVSEDPLRPGLFYGIDSPEFSTHAAGQVVTLQGDPARNGGNMPLRYITARSTASYDEANIHPDHSGLYRDPLPLSDGSVLVSHTNSKLPDENIGSTSEPRSRYDFRLKTLIPQGEVWVAGGSLTAGVQVSVSYFTPDEHASYSGPLWELQPVELIAKSKPRAGGSVVEAPERQVFEESGVDIDQFRRELAERNLALIVMRDVTSRDRSDLQQPFNVRVFEGFAQSIKLPGHVYDLSHLQLFQGDQIRGYGGVSSPERGRRVLSTFMHDALDANPPLSSGPRSSVRVAPDGSVAALVPARRALTWQLTDPEGGPVVRERYWLTFQPGEIRVCASCHGVNSVDQLGRQPPVNSPEALRSLLGYLRNNPLPEGPGPTPVPSPVPTAAAPGGYNLSVRGPAGSTLLSGRPVSLSVSSAEGAEQARLSLGIRVGAKLCPRRTRSFVTGSSHQRIIEGKAPRSRRKELSLVFTLHARAGIVATAQSVLTNPSGGVSRDRVLSRGEFRRLCANFRRLR